MQSAGKVDVGWVALSLAGRIGSKTLRALMSHFGNDPYAVLNAEAAALRAVPGVGPKIAAAIRAVDINRIAADLERWQRAGVSVLTQHDPAYPDRLRYLDDAPPTLFVRGAFTRFVLDPPERTVALIGTREPSQMAANVAHRLGAELARRGYVVISGLAMGIDTHAHIGSLSVPGSRTFAVLGSGVLNIYPQANTSLAETIMLCDGLLMCEVHPHATVNSAGLVARNRILSGLSDAVIVVETSEDGGAMHAARFARTQGRPLYALDLPASGNRALLSDGAGMIPADLRGLPL